jgi:hypothetical protein
MPRRLRRLRGGWSSVAWEVDSRRERRGFTMDCHNCRRAVRVLLLEGRPSRCITQDFRRVAAWKWNRSAAEFVRTQTVSVRWQPELCKPGGGQSMRNKEVRRADLQAVGALSEPEVEDRIALDEPLPHAVDSKLRGLTTIESAVDAELDGLDLDHLPDKNRRHFVAPQGACQGGRGATGAGVRWPQQRRQ